MTQTIVPPVAVGAVPAAVTPASAPPVAAPAVAQPAPTPDPQPAPVQQVAPVVAPTAAAPAVAAQPVRPQSGDGTAATGAASVPTDKLVEAYVQLRDDKDRIQARHKEELAVHNQMIDKIAGELDSRLVREGTKTFSTEHGAATRIITTNAVCNDWEAFEEWVIATRNFSVFPKKLNYAPFKEMVANEQPLPPGVRLERSARLQVRRKS